MLDLFDFLRAVRGAVWGDPPKPGIRAASAPPPRPTPTAPGRGPSCCWAPNPVSGEPAARRATDRATASPKAGSRPRIARVLLPARRKRAASICHRAVA